MPKVSASPLSIAPGRRSDRIMHCLGMSDTSHRLAQFVCVGVVVALGGCQTVPRDATAPGDTSEMHRIAGQIGNQGKPALAASLYQQAVDRNPTADNFVALGRARLAADQPQQAADAFRSALKIEGSDSNALLGLGEARRRLGQFAYAVRALAPAASRLNTVHAWTELGLAYVGSGDADAAVGAFGHAMQGASSNDLDVQTNLALAEALAGQGSQATVRMREVCNSPLAETRHFRDLLLILVLAGQNAQADSLEVPGMEDARKQALLSHARQIRMLTGTAARAHAIGLITNG